MTTTIDRMPWVRRALERAEGTPRSAGLLVLRAYVAFAILYGHAVPKLGEMASGEGHFPELVEAMGFPAPMFFAWLATLSQAGGAIMLMAGAGTRLGAFLVLSTLVVGVLGVHLGDPFPRVEAGILYIVALAAFMVLGAGDFSVDALLLRRTGPQRVGPHQIGPQ